MWITPHIQNEIQETDGVLDLCCGYGHAIGEIRCQFYVGVDIDCRQLDRHEAVLPKTGKILVEADVATLPTGRFNYPFDIAMCIGGIEHLAKPNALCLLKKMEHWARKVIVVTPDAFFDNRCNDVSGEEWDSDYQLHKCLITEREFLALGYKVKVKQPEILGHNCMMYVKAPK